MEKEKYVEKEGEMVESITFAIEPELKKRYEDALEKEERNISNGTRYLIRKYLGDIE